MFLSPKVQNDCKCQSWDISGSLFSLQPGFCRGCGPSLQGPELPLLLLSDWVVSHSATPWAAARQASPSFTISQEFAQTHAHWIGDAIPLSHPLSPLSPPAFNLSQHQGLFQWVDTLHQVAKVLELQLQHQSFPWIFRVDFLRMDWFDLLAVQRTLKSLLQQHSLKASILCHSAFFMVQLSHWYMTTGKTIALTRWTFVGKVMCLLLNTLSRFVLAFLPKNKCLLTLWLQSRTAVIMETKKINLAVCIVSPSICHEVTGLDVMLLLFWMLSFKPVFSLSSFTLIKRHFSSSYLFCHYSPAYLRLLRFLPAILIPVCASSNPAFCMMYSAHKLNKQGEYIQPWHTPFPILNLSS